MYQWNLGCEREGDTKFVSLPYTTPLYVGQYKKIRYAIVMVIVEWFLFKTIDTLYVFLLYIQLN